LPVSFSDDASRQRALSHARLDVPGAGRQRDGTYENGGYMGGLTEAPAFLATTFVVIDFETTTPAGYPAQPIEVAALALSYEEGAWRAVGRSDAPERLI
jgi:hypothetical protein